MTGLYHRLAVSVFTFLLLTGSSSQLSAAPVTQLKVMSFNIWVQGGLSLSNCIEVIRTSGADIVGLQECNATTAQTIATSLGFYVLPATDNSIVSRYHIIATQVIGNSRGATIQLSPGQRVYLFDCHLTSDPYGPYDLKNGQTTSYITNQENTVRMPALLQLLGAMQPAIAYPEPCFLVGDFNAPSHLDYANFPWPTSLASIQAGLIDSYRQLHPTNRTFPTAFGFNEPGITWTPKTNQEPNGVYDRIDFVYYTPGDGATPTNSVELDERNSINPWPSDHRAVLTTFALTPPAQTLQASFPVPATQATNIALNPILSWLPGSNALSHDLFFGAVNTGLLFVTNTTNSYFALTNLLPGTTYFWRVDENTPSGNVGGNIWTFTTKSNVTSVYEWTFANGDLTPSLGNGILAYADGATPSLTSFGTTDGTVIPHIGGKPAKYLRAPAFTNTANGYTVTFPNSGPNGNGAYINQYTMIFDFLVPNNINWLPLFNTNPQNGNDADFYVNPSGALGIAAIGYSANSMIVANTWYRVAFVADLAAGTVGYFRNGTRIFTGSSALDGRFSIYSNIDPGVDLLLFNEGDTSGIYTHEVYLSSFMFTDRTMSDAEITALGGPQARGILTPATPIKLSVSIQGANAVLSWSGGDGPYQLQRAFTLTNNLAWQDIGAPTSGTNTTLPHDGNRAFFRVKGQ